MTTPVQYYPNLPCNLIYAILLAGCAVVQIWMGVSYRQWTFSALTTASFLLEASGLAIRPWLRLNQGMTPISLFSITSLTIGPGLIAISVLLSLTRWTKLVRDTACSSKYRYAFSVSIALEVICIALQLDGGLQVAISAPRTSIETASRLEIIGAVLQLLNLITWLGYATKLMHDLFQTTSRNIHIQLYSGDRRAELKYTANLTALAVAVLSLLARSVFKICQSQQGKLGYLTTDEFWFLFLDGAMVVLAVHCLTIPWVYFHLRDVGTNIFHSTFETRDSPSKLRGDIPSVISVYKLPAGDKPKIVETRKKISSGPVKDKNTASSETPKALSFPAKLKFHLPLRACAPDHLPNFRNSDFGRNIDVQLMHQLDSIGRRRSYFYRNVTEDHGPQSGTSDAIYNAHGKPVWFSLAQDQFNMRARALEGEQHRNHQQFRLVAESHWAERFPPESRSGSCQIGGRVDTNVLEDSTACFQLQEPRKSWI